MKNTICAFTYEISLVMIALYALLALCEGNPYHKILVMRRSPIFGVVSLSNILDNKSVIWKAMMLVWYLRNDITPVAQYLETFQAK